MRGWMVVPLVDVVDSNVIPPLCFDILRTIGIVSYRQKARQLLDPFFFSLSL